MTYTEYGLWPVTRPSYGCGDNPAFINRMADWVESHPVAHRMNNKILHALLLTAR
jgi:hypothetical protein